jgi:hypothetical protein
MIPGGEVGMQLGTYTRLTVLLGIAAAAIGWLGMAGWMAAAVLMVSVGLHVAGNCIGTRMRDQTDQVIRRRIDRRGADPVPAALPLATPSRLERRESLGRTLPIAASIGAICGGAVGTSALLMLTAASPAGAVLGGLSSAVMGGFFGFLAASFVEVVRTCLREAIEAEKPPAAGNAPSTNSSRPTVGG